jgi:hypothetical protein
VFEKILIGLALSTIPNKYKSKSAQGRAGAKSNPNVVGSQLYTSHPPQFTATVRFARKARFLTTAPAFLSLTRAMLLNHLVVAKTTTTATRILSGFRLKSIQIWNFPTSTSSSLQFTPSVVSVEWTSTYGPSKIIQDTSMAIQAAYVQTSPPRNSLASFWSLSGSNESDVLAILTLPTSSVIDITYECILQNGEIVTALSPTQVMTAGTVYMSYLDGIAGTGLIPPLSYSSVY